jgi:hypothetical protein
MSKVNKIILLVTTSIMLLLITLTFIISQRIDLNEIKVVSKENIENLFPGSKVEIGKVDHSLGSSIRIFLNDIVVTNKQSKEILKVKKFIIKFPITTLLIDKGNVDLKAESLLLNFSNYKSINKNEANNKKSNYTQSKIKLPSFVKTNRVNLKIIDSIILKDKTQLEFNKIIVKNINFKSSVAFEIKSKFSTTLVDWGKIHSNLQLVGEVNLKDYLKKNELEGKILLTSKNLILEEINKTIPEFNQKIEFKYDRSGFYDIKTELFSEAVTLNAQGAMIDDELSLKKLDLEVNSNVLKKDNLIRYNDSKIIFSGSLLLALSNFKLIPNMKIKLTKPFLLNIDNFDSIPLNINGEIIGEKVVVRSSSIIKTGFIEQSLNFNLNNYLNKEISDFKYNVLADKLTLSQLEYDSLKKIRINLKNSIKNKSINIEVKNTKINGHKVNLKTNINTVDNEHTKLAFLLKSKTESLKINLKNNNYLIEMKKVNSNLVKDLFIPFFPILNSQLSGKMSFRLDQKKILYARGDFKGVGGDFVNNNAIEILKTSKIKNYKLIMRMKRNTPIVKTLKIVGYNNLFTINSSGTLVQNVLDLNGNIFAHSQKVPFKVSGDLDSLVWKLGK